MFSLSIVIVQEKVGLLFSLRKSEMRMRNVLRPFGCILGSFPVRKVRTTFNNFSVGNSSLAELSTRSLLKLIQRRSTSSQVSFRQIR